MKFAYLILAAALTFITVTGVTIWLASAAWVRDPERLSSALRMFGAASLLLLAVVHSVRWGAFIDVRTGTINAVLVLLAIALSACVWRTRTQPRVPQSVAQD